MKKKIVPLYDDGVYAEETGYHPVVRKLVRRVGGEVIKVRHI